MKSLTEKQLERLLKDAYSLGKSHGISVMGAKSRGEENDGMDERQAKAVEDFIAGVTRSV